MYRVTITKKATDRYCITNHLLFYSALREKKNFLDIVLRSIKERNKDV